MITGTIGDWKCGVRGKEAHVHSRGQRGLAVLLSVLLLVVFGGAAARASDDNENSTPTAWWMYTGQSYTDVLNTVKAKNARIVDIAPDNAAGSTFTVSYVQNTGAYAKGWWWYVGIDANTVTQNLKNNNARLISLKAYDTGGGNLRFAVAMVANTGADAKGWWWYYGQTPTQIGNLTKANNARLTTIQSYTWNGQTVYAVVMIANTGADAKGWWWYYNASPQAIGGYISTNKARLLDLTPAGNGNFNVAMESCSGGCPAWWWYYGMDGNDVITRARDNGARVFATQRYQGCSAGQCLATVMIGNTPADVTACDAQGCISEAKFSANICGKLDGHVVGYSCQVGQLRPQFGGMARTSANAPSLSMTPDLVTNIASVSKTMTAIAVLQLLAKNNLTIDTKIAPYLYADWSKGTNINQLTFKELLTHSTGFGQLPGNACGNGITYGALKSIVAGGVATANIGQPDYGNCNFALLRELMPALQGQSLANYADGPARAQQSSAMYVSYMNSHVFGPAGVPASQCKPPAGTKDVLSYTNPAGATSGTDWGDWSLQCGGGGWVLSANNIFDVVSNVATGGNLLTRDERKQMLANCLGWDCAVRSDCPGPYACKNGDLNNGSGGIAVWTYAGIFKCNVPVVVVVNSPLPAPYQGGEDIIGLVKDAYQASAVPGAPQSCPN